MSFDERSHEQATFFAVEGSHARDRSRSRSRSTIRMDHLDPVVTDIRLYRSCKTRAIQNPPSNRATVPKNRLIMQILPGKHDVDRAAHLNQTSTCAELDHEWRRDARRLWASWGGRQYFPRPAGDEHRGGRGWVIHGEDWSHEGTRHILCCRSSR